MLTILDDESRINLSIPVALLARLFANQQLCAADLQSLDAESHAILHRLMLSVCAQQLKGDSPQCDACPSQRDCQQSSSWTTSDTKLTPIASSLSLH